MAAYSSSESSSSPAMNYSTANLPLPMTLPDAPPIRHHHYLPPLAVVGRPPPSSFAGGGKSTPTRTVAAYRAASAMPAKTGEHVGDVFMMQASDGGNGGSSTNTRDVKKSWIVDSGAAVHATGDRDLFSSFEDITTTRRLRMANGSMVDITGRGTVRHHDITLHGVLYAHGLAVNTVSVAKLGQLDYSVEFIRTSCFIRDAGTGELVGKGHQLANGMFELDFLEA